MNKSGYIFPAMTVDNFIDAGTLYAINLGDLSKSASGFCEQSYARDLRDIQNSLRAPSFPILFYMFKVLSWRYSFKICGTIIFFIQVLVINMLTTDLLWNEGQRDKAMYREVNPLCISRKFYFFISTATYTGLQNITAPMITNASARACVVTSLVSRYGFPDFFGAIVSRHAMALLSRVRMWRERFGLTGQIAPYFVPRMVQ